MCIAVAVKLARRAHVHVRRHGGVSVSVLMALPKCVGRTVATDGLRCGARARQCNMAFGLTSRELDLCWDLGRRLGGRRRCCRRRHAARGRVCAVAVQHCAVGSVYHLWNAVKVGRQRGIPACLNLSSCHVERCNNEKRREQAGGARGHGAQATAQRGWEDKFVLVVTCVWA